MKTVLVLAGLVALSLASVLPTSNYEVETKSVDAEFVGRQKKIFQFFHFTEQVNPSAEYYKVGKEFDITNPEHYTDKEAVEEFNILYRDGFLSKDYVFSIFNERIRYEAIALFKLFYFAKDFDTFYKTAAYARVHFNDHMFYYSLYVAIFHREDTQGIVVPAPYEVFPEFFTNMETIFKAYRIKMQDGIINEEDAKWNGIVKEDKNYVIYSNYSDYWTYGEEESRLSYFTEDIGLNTYYYFFHTYLPFWMQTSDKFAILKERRGEFYYFFYQQLLSRYYMERLSNGLGEIPDFSWNHPLYTQYKPHLTTSAHPFAQRPEYFYMQTEQNIEYLQFLDNYEKTFLQYLQRGHFKAYNHEIDLRNSKSINFVGNYWQSNADLYEKSERNYLPSYEHIARLVLSGVPEAMDKRLIAPSALSFYMTSARDPAFYQLYSKIMKYVVQYKEHLQPYTKDNLHYVGVKINDVAVSKLRTFFDYYDYEINNAVYASAEELKGEHPVFKVRQPRLDHKPFTVTIDVKSDVEGDAVFKVFLGPKYNNKGYPINIEDNWQNFIELDWFVQKLTAGQNKIERKSEEFFYYKQDSLPTSKVMELLEQGKVPKDQAENYEWLPKRLMLPRGTEGGFPFQLFVFVYPHETLPKEYEPFKSYFVDTKPMGYPFDRPVYEPYFHQPNMFFEDVLVYFEGEHFTYNYNNPFYTYHMHENSVPKN